MMKLTITPYTVPAALPREYRLALVTDMHNTPGDDVLRALDGLSPDAVVIAGDMMTEMGKKGEHAMRFLSDAAERFPVFYGFGNHEKFFGAAEFSAIRETGVTLLINDFVRFGDLCIGAPKTECADSAENREFLERFSMEDGFRILLSHRPEWYHRYLRSYDIPLVLSGHAHGGQVRLFGIPLYAPGQGFFPRYAQGMHENRLIVSRGIGNHVIIPRIFNTPEICLISLTERETLCQPS